VTQARHIPLGNMMRLPLRRAARMRRPLRASALIVSTRCSASSLSKTRRHRPAHDMHSARATALHFFLDIEFTILNNRAGWEHSLG
jgi:hypothetical protein